MAKELNEIVEIEGFCFSLQDLKFVGPVIACNEHEIHNHSGGIAHMGISIGDQTIVLDLDGYLTAVKTRRNLIAAWVAYKRSLNGILGQNKNCACAQEGSEASVTTTISGESEV